MLYVIDTVFAAINDTTVMIGRANTIVRPPPMMKMIFTATAIVVVLLLTIAPERVSGFVIVDGSRTTTSTTVPPKSNNAKKTFHVSSQPRRQRQHHRHYGSISPLKLSNAVCRFSLHCLVFEISGGGGRSSPPPVGAKLAQTPVGARVNIGVKGPSMICIPRLGRAAISDERGCKILASSARGYFLTICFFLTADCDFKILEPLDKWRSHLP